MSRRINWTTAPAVPLHILNAEKNNQQFPGEIVEGPYGQRAYFAGTQKKGVNVTIPQVPGGVAGGIEYGDTCN